MEQPMRIKNIFSEIPRDLPEEVSETLVETPQFRVERIVSMGQFSPQGFWYDQDTDEWVILLAGAAGICFESQRGVVELLPGDYLHIPAHERHRVAWTKTNTPTVWLAIHYQGPS